MPELEPALRDEIDDQVAEAFDVYLAQRLAEPGPLRTVLRVAPGAGLVLTTVALGVLATIFAPAGTAVVSAIWLAITATNVIWLLCAHRD